MLAKMLDSIKTFRETLNLLARIQAKTVVSYKVHDLSGNLLKTCYTQAEFEQFSDSHRGKPVLVEVLYLEEVSV